MYILSSLHFTFTQDRLQLKTPHTGMATARPQSEEPEAEDSFYSPTTHRSRLPPSSKHDRSSSLDRNEKSVRTMVRNIDARSSEIPPTAVADTKQLKKSKSVSCLKSNPTLQLDNELATPSIPVKFQGCFLVDLPTWQPSDRLFRQKADARQDMQEGTSISTSSSRTGASNASRQRCSQLDGIAF